MAGESARREYERIRDARRRRVRDHRGLLLVLTAVSMVGGAVAMHVLLGLWWVGVLLGLLPLGSILAPSQREVAWRKGAEGEQLVGRALDAIGGSSRVLHDRRIPRSRANIDHILIAPTGVWTIDAKNYTGKLETRRRGQELWINGRNRSKLLDQARRQTAVVRDVLAAAGLGSVPVRPALCFVGVEWPWLFPPRIAGDVALASPRRLSKLATGEAVMSPSEAERVVGVLDRALGRVTDRADHKSALAGTTGTPRSGRSERHDRQPSVATEVMVTPWQRYGKSRLYVNLADGTTLGYVDLQTNTVVPAEERHRETVSDAVTRYFRQN